MWGGHGSIMRRGSDSFGRRRSAAAAGLHQAAPGGLGDLLVRVVVAEDVQHLGGALVLGSPQLIQHVRSSGRRRCRRTPRRPRGPRRPAWRRRPPRCRRASPPDRPSRPRSRHAAAATSSPAARAGRRDGSSRRRRRRVPNTVPASSSRLSTSPGPWSVCSAAATSSPAPDGWSRRPGRQVGARLVLGEHQHRRDQRDGVGGRRIGAEHDLDACLGDELGADRPSGGGQRDQSSSAGGHEPEVGQPAQLVVDRAAAERSRRGGRTGRASGRDARRCRPRDAPSSPASSNSASSVTARSPSSGHAQQRPGHRAAEADLQRRADDPLVGVAVGAVGETGHRDEPPAQPAHRACRDGRVDQPAQIRQLGRGAERAVGRVGLVAGLQLGGQPAGVGEPQVALGGQRQPGRARTARRARGPARASGPGRSPPRPRRRSARGPARSPTAPGSRAGPAPRRRRCP